MEEIPLSNRGHSLARCIGKKHCSFQPWSFPRTMHWEETLLFPTVVIPCPKGRAYGMMEWR